MKLEKILHYMFYCHRLPERSFFYKGKQFPICARCTGILVGYIVAIIYLFFLDIPPAQWIALFLIPLLIDGGGQYMGWWESTNPRRFITGVFAGVATIFIFDIIAQLGYYQGQQLAKLIIK